MERTALIYNKGVWEPGCFGDRGLFLMRGPCHWGLCIPGRRNHNVSVM